LYKALHAKGLVVDIWPPIKECLYKSISDVNCDKCALCRHGDGTVCPEEVCQAYVADRRETRDPNQSRACCLWEHSTSITRIVGVLSNKFDLSDRDLRAYAKRFMSDCLSAHPLGVPTPTNDKHSYKVTLYREVSDSLKAVDRHGNLKSAVSHYVVYMGYRIVL
jgi:hypothetical protein